MKSLTFTTTINIRIFIRWQIYSIQYNNLNSSIYMLGKISIEEAQFDKVQNVFLKLAECSQFLSYTFIEHTHKEDFIQYRRLDQMLTLSICSSIFICFCNQQLLLVKMNHVIKFSQSQQLLLAKKNADQATWLQGLLSADALRYRYRK